MSTATTFVYDAAVLVAADRNDRRAWAEHRTKTADVVGAVVVTVALCQNAIILTSDQDEIQRLVRASGREVTVIGM